jgi:hypothetical protein
MVNSLSLLSIPATSELLLWPLLLGRQKLTNIALQEFRDDHLEFCAIDSFEDVNIIRVVALRHFDVDGTPMPVR